MQKKQILFLLFSFLMAVFFYTSSALGSDYYVLPFIENAPNGDGQYENAATQEDGRGAWNGIENIQWTVIKPGDNIHLKRGAVYYSQIEVLKSGTENERITFKAFGSGENPIITGGKELSKKPSDWRLESEQNRWICSKFSDGTDSNKIYNAALIADRPLVRSYSSDFSKFFGEFSNARFKRSLFEDDAPWNYTIEVSVRPYNVLIDGKSFITFENINFKLSNGWSTPQYGSIHIINNSQHITFKGCNISTASFSGVWVVASNHIILDQCEIFNNYCTGLYFRDGASFAEILDCKIYKNGKYLSVNNPTDTGALLMGSSGTGTGHIIRGNQIYDNGRQTVTERVDGTGPDGDGDRRWVKKTGNIWEKYLGDLKRWGGTSLTQGVQYLGKNGDPLKEAEELGFCDQGSPWLWDREKQLLYYFSLDDPNQTNDQLEIAWYNGTDPAISLWGITNSVIEQNNIFENYCSGIGATYKTSENLTIKDNTITDNLLNSSKLQRSLKYGLGISGQGGHRIEENRIINNGGSEMSGNPQNAGLLISASSISPNNNTIIRNNTIASNGGYQISWFQYLTGEVFNNTFSDYNIIYGNYMIYYLGNEYKELSSYSSVSGQDKNSVVSSSISPPVLRIIE